MHPEHDKVQLDRRNMCRDSLTGGQWQALNEVSLYSLHELGPGNDVSIDVSIPYINSSPG